MFNKYKPGGNGVGACSIAARRAKNRRSTVCVRGTEQCFPCQPFMGQKTNALNSCLAANMPERPPVWSHENFNPQNTRQSMQNGIDSYETTETWKFTPDAESQHFNENQLVIGPTGIVYTIDNGGTIYALVDNGGTFSVLFSRSTGYSSLRPPTIGLDNIMYFSATNTVKSITKINTSSPSSGWTFTSTSLSSPFDMTSPYPPIIGEDGKIFVSTANGYIVAINGKNGAPLWTYHSSTNNIIYLAIGHNGVIYAVEYRTSKLVAMAQSGGVLWILTTNTTFSNFSVPVVGRDGTIYVVSSEKVWAFTDNGSSGSENWGLTIDSTLNPSISIGLNNRLYVSYGSHIAAITDNVTSGQINWSIDVGFSGITDITLGRNGTLYFTSAYTKLTSVGDLGDTAVVNWSEYVDSGGNSSACSIGLNGTIYFGGDHNMVLARGVR